jgi:hypothetical protein
MEPDFEIRLAGRIEPRPKPAAADELAIAVIEQRPILNPFRDIGLLRMKLAAATNELSRMAVCAADTRR